MKHILTFAALVFATSCFGQVPDYVPTDGLVAWLSFNNGVLDEGPLNNTATDFGSEGTFDRFGLPDAARNFNAARVELANSDVIDQFKTVSQWTRTESSSRQVSFKQNVFIGALQERVIITQNFNGDNCHFGIKESCGGSWNFGNQPFDVSDGAWHHFVGVVLPEETRLYVDGVLISIVSIVSASETCSGGDIIIGSEWSGVDYDFQGDIDDVGLWDRPLDEEEILGLFLADAPIYGCTDDEACNFNPNANVDDSSCLECELFEARCGPGTVWDDSVQLCLVANPSDTDFDGCVSMTDLLDLLTVFGTCSEIPFSCGDPLEYQGHDYETVQIGERCWFAENLRTSSYRNGDQLLGDLSDEEWSNATEGAQCAFADNAANVPITGRLYNYIAVVDDRGICPSGWHVPVDAEWVQMANAIGGVEVAGLAMKNSESDYPSWDGTNSSGFSGAPGGKREMTGVFGGGSVGYWWTSTPLGCGAWHRNLHLGNDALTLSSYCDVVGFSVRCIKDSE